MDSNINQGHLPKEYLNRDASDSSYHSILLNKWTHKDVIDFLFDLELYLMMPLCESLDGYGLYKLFRMCQNEPIHFYSQLHDELRAQFDNLLPIGIFTQFLTEVEQIIHSLPTQNIEQDAIQSESVSPSLLPSNIVTTSAPTIPSST
jgi:hypothetical protein